MFISPAYAQAGGGSGGGGLEALLPLILIFVVFYFLLIRPQQKKMKHHREMLTAIRRGDKVVTGGGIMGSVTKVDGDTEITVEIAKDVKVKVRRDLVSSVVSKTAPQAAASRAANEDRPQGGILSRLLGGGTPQQQAANAPAEGLKVEPTTEAQNSDDNGGEDAPEKKAE